MDFDDSAIVERILNLHGENELVMKLEHRDDVWYLRGMNPRVANERPQARGMSENYDPRDPDDIELRNVVSMIPDAFEMLRKASQSRSQQASCAKDAKIGEVSIMASIKFDSSSTLHDSLKNEMIVNSHTMDKLRYLMLSTILCESVLAHVNTALEESKEIGDGNIIVNSRTIQDSSLEVCTV